MIAAVAFYRPLRELVRFAAHSELYSHIFLIPVISLYLVWTNRKTLPVGKSSFAVSLIAYVPALILVGLFFANPTAAFWKVKSNYLSVFTTAMMLTCIGNLLLLLGVDFVRAALFPTLFLLAAAPFPETVLDGTRNIFPTLIRLDRRHYVRITDTTVLHDGLFFQLPGITLQVAQECSGIHSSLVLMLTSFDRRLLFFLNTTVAARCWRFSSSRSASFGMPSAFSSLASFACMSVPDMINSYIHHHGGPIFFAISLVPFFILLHYLRKLDRRMSVQTSGKLSASSVNYLNSNCKVISLFLIANIAVITGCSKEAKIARYRERANKHYAAGQYAEAEVEYMNLLRSYPQDKVAIRQLGSSFSNKAVCRKRSSSSSKPTNWNPTISKPPPSSAIAYIAALQSKKLKSRPQDSRKTTANESALTLTR